MTHTIHRSLATLIVLFGVACTSDGRAPDSAVATRAPADSTRQATPAPSSGPATDAGVNGLWTIASLEKRLDLQGMVPIRMPDTIRHSFFSVPGTGYRLGNAELQVFIYRDTVSRARDVSLLDTATVSPRGTTPAWAKRATLVTNANLAAILLSDNALQTERVQRALMAGTGSTVLSPPR